MKSLVKGAVVGEMKVHLMLILLWLCCECEWNTNNYTLIIKHLESLLKAVLCVDEHFTRIFVVGSDDSGGGEAGNIKFLSFTFFSSSALSHYVSGHETQTPQTRSITNISPRRLNKKNFLLLIHLQQTRSERWDEKKMKMKENISIPFPALIENSHSAQSVLWLVCLFIFCLSLNQTIIIKYWCWGSLVVKKARARKQKTEIRMNDFSLFGTTWRFRANGKKIPFSAPL